MILAQSFYSRNKAFVSVGHTSPREWSGVGLLYMGDMYMSLQQMCYFVPYSCPIRHNVTSA